MVNHLYFSVWVWAWTRDLFYPMGMSADVMQAEAWNTHMQLGLSSVLHVNAMKRICASWPLSSGEDERDRPEPSLHRSVNLSWPAHVHVIAVLRFCVYGVLFYSIIMCSGCYCRQHQGMQEKAQEKIVRKSKTYSTSALFLSLVVWFYHQVRQQPTGDRAQHSFYGFTTYFGLEFLNLKSEDPSGYLFGLMGACK